MTTKRVFWGLVLIFSLIVPASAVKPKYGPEAEPLSFDSDYFTTAPAKAFWSLIPYYQPQENPSGCSVASVAIVVNAARAVQNGARHKSLTADDKLVSQTDLVEKVSGPFWKKGKYGLSVTLDELKQAIEASLKVYDIQADPVEMVRAEANPEIEKQLRAALSEMEKSKNVFIISNFLQSVYTSDADVGHVSPVGAYDPKHKKVLILDVDRSYYEPYWVSESTFLKGMATRDSASGKNRGYVVVRVR